MHPPHTHTRETTLSRSWIRLGPAPSEVGATRGYLPVLFIGLLVSPSLCWGSQSVGYCFTLGLVLQADVEGGGELTLWLAEACTEGLYLHGGAGVGCSLFHLLDGSCLRFLPLEPLLSASWCGSAAGPL